MAREHRVWDEYVSQTNHAVIVVIPILVLLAHTVLGTRTLVMLCLLYTSDAADE